jgi:hypothetical protein
MTPARTTPTPPTGQVPDLVGELVVDAATLAAYATDAEKTLAGLPTKTMRDAHQQQTATHMIQSCRFGALLSLPIPGTHLIEATLMPSAEVLAAVAEFRRSRRLELRCSW